MDQTELQAAAPAATPKQTRLRLPILVVCALIGGGIGGTGGFALAAGPWAGGWHHGLRLERMQQMVGRALDSVGASTAQEGKIHDIISKNFADTDQGGENRQALRKQMIELLRAPTVDRAAVEKLRGEQVAAFDARTKAMVGSILDAADQLTPDQRTKLADRFEMMAQHHHGMGGPGEGRWGGRHGGPGDGHSPMDDGDGQHDGAPNGNAPNGADKG